MAYPMLIESADRLEISSPVGWGMRLFLAVAGCFPLLAPYELLIKVTWTHYANLFFIFAAIISAGAIALSGALFFAAIAGQQSQIILDKPSATFCYTSVGLMGRPTRRIYPLEQVARVEVGVQSWSDGPPTHSIQVVMCDGRVFKSGSTESQAWIMAIQRRMTQFLMV
jgi:hypothetical protein